MNATEVESTSLDQLLWVAKAILEQALVLVREALSSDDQLSYPSKYIPGSTIGKHLRHARDHFVLLADSVSSPKSGSAPILSYDVRSRNTPMEKSRKAAIDALVECIEKLEKTVPGAVAEAPITLHAVTPFPQVLQTTFGRELWFASLHAIHHWSMVRVIAGEQNIALEDSFGVAPSTLVHRGSDVPLGKPKI